MEIKVSPDGNSLIYRVEAFGGAWFDPIFSQWYREFECNDWTEYISKEKVMTDTT